MDFSSVLPFDMMIMNLVNGSDSLFLDNVVMTLTQAATWIPLYVALMYMVIRNNETMSQIVLFVACAVACVAVCDIVVDGIVKPLTMRLRPSHDPNLIGFVDVVNGYRGGLYGFFSAHAANTFSIALFFSLAVRSKLLTIGMISWSLLNCYTRMYLGVHFPTDILAGLLFGTLVGVCFYFVYRYFYERITVPAEYISKAYTSTGYSFEEIYIVLSVLFITLLYVIIRAALFI